MAAQACQFQTRGFRLPGFHIPNRVILNRKIKRFCLASVVTVKEKKKGNCWLSKTIDWEMLQQSSPSRQHNVTWKLKGFTECNVLYQVILGWEIFWVFLRVWISKQVISVLFCLFEDISIFINIPKCERRSECWTATLYVRWNLTCLHHS